MLSYPVLMAPLPGRTGLAGFLLWLLWSLRSGQYDGMHGAALRILSD